MSVLAKVVKKLVNPAKIVTWIFRSAAEGDFGPVAKKVYWFLAGKKTWVIAILSAFGAFLVELEASPADCAAIQCTVIYKYLNTYGPVIVAALTASALDDALRQEPPTPPKK